MCRLILLSAALLCFAADSVSAAEKSADLRFETHVRSILKKHCFQCHGEEEHPEGELDLRLVHFMQQGGDSGPAVIAGRPDESLLLQRVRNGEMPPDSSKLLAKEEISILEGWIAAGAETVRPEPESIDGTTFITEEERAHWSFQPIVRPAVPQVVHSDAVANPIDAFLLERLEQQGFSFSSRAEPHTLMRRLHLDLTGLPPAPETVKTFAKQPGPTQWRAVIDDLLDSPRYGERWGRHWLDVAGYADSEGYNEADAERPHAWRYRDYVIRSFNDDKPFDQFIREQLAGDELVTTPMDNLSPEDAELLSATGFLRMAPDGTGGSVPDASVARNETIADTIKIVSSSLLGMTVGCAQCHDHRYDPISQADYYRFRAIFEPALDWKNWRNPAQRRVSLYTDEDRAEAARVEAEAKKIDAERLKKQAEFIEATFEKQLTKLPVEIHEVARTAHQTDPKSRTPEQKALFKKHPSLNVTAGSLYLYDKKAADQLAAMADDAKKLRATKPQEQFVRALTEVPGQRPVTHLFYRGDHEQPKQELTPAGLTVISEVAQLGEIPVENESLSSSGRRLALANRLTNPRHPLTARVIVNRVWLHHFGRGLVNTPGDFGTLGEAPSHPQLLDWLAAEFIDSGWSLKHLHRLILTSTAWQQKAADNPELAAVDPDNTLYGTARLIRLDAEVIRDSMLMVSGRLNSKAFGAAVPVMADRVGRFVIGRENLNAGRPGPRIDMKGEEFRRSVYIQVRRSRPLSVMSVFDQPIMSPNCDMRRPSTSSTQSLLMINSDLLLEYSQSLADRLERDGGNDVSDRIRLAWQLVYAREPEHSELDEAVKLLDDQTAIFREQPAYQPDAKSAPARTPEQEAMALMCQMLLSSSEFLYVD